MKVPGCKAQVACKKKNGIQTERNEGRTRFRAWTTAFGWDEGRNGKREEGGKMEEGRGKKRNEGRQDDRFAWTKDETTRGKMEE